MTFDPAITGYFGKLPARGDFVRGGLPEEFVTPWDGWCREMLNASRAALGDDWQAAWMEAPIWRFLLPPGPCGGLAVLGVWLPSVDKVGRHFPFLCAALAPSIIDLETGAAWVDLAEAVALSGVVDDAAHEDFLSALGAPVADAPPLEPGWWTEGSPRVQKTRCATVTLPDQIFAGAMLRDAQTAEAF